MRLRKSAPIRTLRGYFLEQEATFWVALPPLMLLSALLFTRSLTTNFIFDEQEALLANPYVNSAQNLGFWDAVHRDFWGLPHDRSVGSYRPLPNMLWRLVATGMHATHSLASRVIALPTPSQLHPWIFHWVNVLLHAINGALLTAIVYRAARRQSLAWLAGGIFVGCAVLTEAVSGVVGIADVLGGLFALLALAALGLPLKAMTMGVFASTLLGLFSKESAIVCVPLIPIAALLMAPNTHPLRPRRVVRFAMAAMSTTLAFVLYVALRKHWFPAPIAPELLTPLAEDAGPLTRAMRSFLLFYGQPSLPKDPMNNPLILADVPHRVAGALRVFARGLGQVVFPLRLSGDYSFPQEPIPDRLVFAESVIGGLAMILAPLSGAAIWLRSLFAEARQRRALGVWATAPTAILPWRTSLAPIVAVSLVWAIVSYFPHSNIPTLLPTVRAERFWYFPAIGTSVLLACLFVWLFDRTKHFRKGLPAIVAFGLFFGFQCVRARAHAFDYVDDLTFWAATREAVPRSAKAHLNHSVMWGARGRLDIRLSANETALALAPDWPMANVYMGDTLCRLHRSEEAWPHYRQGFRLAPNDPNLIALALQCLWDEKALEPHREELLSLAEQHPGTWLAYLAKDIVDNGKEHDGVAPQHRPRGYNEGPRE